MIIMQLKTAVLLATLSGILLCIGGLIGGTSGITAALFIALIINGISYFFSDKIVLSMYRAKKLDPVHYAHIYETVEFLSQEMRLPMPKLWLIDSPIANAFATGRNPAHASVAVTTRIVSILTHDELRGVLAHELSHVANRDILVGSVAATIALAISYIAQMLEHMVWWSAFSSNSKEREGRNPFALLVAAILMPIAAALIQSAISRSRELMADERGARACRDPLALASALEKLEETARRNSFGSAEETRTATAHLFTVSPLKAHGIAHLFSTHPPTALRVERLKKLYEQLFTERGRGYGSES